MDTFFFVLKNSIGRAKKMFVCEWYFFLLKKCLTNMYKCVSLLGDKAIINLKLYCMENFYSKNGTYRSLAAEEIGGRPKRSSYYRVEKEPYSVKVARFLKDWAQVNYVCSANGVKNGDTVQLQRPSQLGAFAIEVGDNGRGERQYLEDVILVAGNTKGLHHYVADLNQSKNSGRYQNLAVRVKESETYLVSQDALGRFRLELLLKNQDWLKEYRSKKAFDNLREKLFGRSVSGLRVLATANKFLTEVGDLELKNVQLLLGGGRSLELKIARIQKLTFRNNTVKYIVLSLNSGKFWVLDEENVIIREDMSERMTVMTNFVYLKRTSTSTADFAITV